MKNKEKDKQPGQMFLMSVLKKKLFQVIPFVS